MLKFLLFVISVFFFGCATTFPRYVRTPQQMEVINGSVVAIVFPAPNSVGLMKVRCAGTFISQTQILTASHCVGSSGSIFVVTYQDFNETDGLITSDTNLTLFVVEKINRSVDLALLKPGPRATVPPHRSLEIAPEGPEQGETVVVIGNPYDLPWTLSQGVVSFARRVVYGMPVVTIQQDSDISPGNSGGALLNHDNQIVGVPILVDGRAAHLNLSVHTDTIHQFLDE